jgi:hypothetical protein
MRKVPDTGSADIDSDEWLRELESLSHRSDKGHTSREWSEIIGHAMPKTLRLLGRAASLGWLVRGVRSTVRIDGKQNTVPVYRIVRPRAIVARGARRKGAR